MYIIIYILAFIGLIVCLFAGVVTFMGRYEILEYMRGKRENFNGRYGKGK